MHVVGNFYMPYHANTPAYHAAFAYVGTACNAYAACNGGVCADVDIMGNLDLII